MCSSDLNPVCSRPPRISSRTKYLLLTTRILLHLSLSTSGRLLKLSRLIFALSFSKQFVNFTLPFLTSRVLFLLPRPLLWLSVPSIPSKTFLLQKNLLIWLALCLQMVSLILRSTLKFLSRRACQPQLLSLLSPIANLVIRAINGATIAAMLKVCYIPWYIA